jgi:FixJ family two-component response regulator
LTMVIGPWASICSFFERSLWDLSQREVTARKPMIHTQYQRAFPASTANDPHASSRPIMGCLPIPPDGIKGAPTVFIVEDAPVVRTALSRLLTGANYRVCSFESTEGYLKELDLESAGCLLLDVSMPGSSGIDLQRVLTKSPCMHPIVFLTGSSDIQTSVNAMKAGAIDFLTKPVDKGRLFAAIDQAMIRDTAWRLKRAIDNSTRRRFDSLTRQERTVMAHIVRGRLNKQIAGDLGISIKTVKVHRERVRLKMRARSVPELVHLGARVGIAIEPVFDSATATLRWR